MQLRSRPGGATPWRRIVPEGTAAGGAPSPDRGGRAPQAPRSAAVGRQEPRPGHRLIGQLEWMLQRLSSAHVRITLVRVVFREPGGLAPRTAETIAEALDDAFGLAGTLTDGSVLAAFFGPRQPGTGGDRQQTQAILRRLRQVMHDAGVGPENSGTSVFLIHRWTDEIGDVSTLMLDSLTMDRAAVALFDPLPA